MSRYTKAQLEEKLDLLEHETRRYRRALNQINIDINVQKNVNVNIERNVNPHEHVAYVLKNAESEWSDNITEPGEGGDSSRITYYIKNTNALGWTWEDDYTRNGQFAWCGAFAAWCWTTVKIDIKKRIFPSCYRLYSNWSQTSRHIEHDKMAPGDIVVVYAAKRSKQGDHITICVEAPDAEGVFLTVEGNAHGTLGDGSHGEGVIRRDRSLDEVAHVYMLLGSDFDE